MLVPLFHSFPPKHFTKQSEAVRTPLRRPFKNVSFSTAQCSVSSFTCMLQILELHHGWYEHLLGGNSDLDPLTNFPTLWQLCATAGLYGLLGMCLGILGACLYWSLAFGITDAQNAGEHCQNLTQTQTLVVTGSSPRSLYFRREREVVGRQRAAAAPGVTVQRHQRRHLPPHAESRRQHPGHQGQDAPPLRDATRT